VFRRDRWWNREIERRERAWATERAELVATICRLASIRAAGDDYVSEPDPEPEPDTDFAPAHADWGSYE
jgi:hypothetical protein